VSKRARTNSQELVVAASAATFPTDKDLLHGVSKRARTNSQELVVAASAATFPTDKNILHGIAKQPAPTRRVGVSGFSLDYFHL
ncbi:MAG: hypothetical protein KBS64_05610, partial [Treponema sp.]|nr:hypothetical protein [Candidatus Treponema equi]